MVSSPRNPNQTREMGIFNKMPSSLEGKQKQVPEGQMLANVGIKFVVLFLAISLSDSLFDLLLWLFDMLVEFIHIVLEAIEYTIEIFLEGTLNTNHQESDIIIINGAIFIAFFLIYRLYLVIPKIYIRLTRKYKAAWLLNKRHRALRWKAMSLAFKIKLLSAYGLGTVCFIFLITL